MSIARHSDLIEASDLSRQVYIDAGRSRRGWSRVGTAMQCLQLFAYQERLGLKLISAAALDMGSIGHVMQAHHHAQIGGRQRGGCVVGTSAGPVHITEPDQVVPPFPASKRWCDEANRGHDHLPMMNSTFRAYREKFGDRSPGDVVAVEIEIEMTLGVYDGEWKFWVTSAPGIPGARVYELDEVTCLDCPGHPEHGEPIQITRRVDLLTRGRSGKYLLFDHKHTGRVDKSSADTGYCVDGGFGFFRMMGKQMFGDEFGDVLVQLIGKRPPHRIERVVVRGAWWRDERLARAVYDKEHEIAALDMEVAAGDRTYYEFGGVFHEVGPCYHRYGRCGAFDLCVDGP